MEGNKVGVTCLALSCDDRYMAYGCFDNSARVWNMQTREEDAGFAGHSQEVLAVAVCWNNKYLVSGAKDMKVKVWSISDGTELFELEYHGKSVTCVTVLEDYETIVTGACDGTVRVWGLRDKQQREVLWHGSAIYSVTASKNNKMIVSCCENSIKVWKL